MHQGRLQYTLFLKGAGLPIEEAIKFFQKKFEKKTMFLPQLLMCAEAAKSAFDVLKVYIAEKGLKEASKGKIILATVKGDIHDIGKNIVKVLLENYGYDVIDLAAVTFFALMGNH